MNINDLEKSITEMTDEELMARIKLLRGERRKDDKPIRKRATSKKPASQRAAKHKGVKNLKSLLSVMSPEERAELLKTLEQKDS